MRYFFHRRASPFLRWSSFIGYSIWRDKLLWVPATRRFLKWTVIAVPLAIFVNVMLFVGEFAYLNRDACDNIGKSPIVINTRGDIAEGRIQIRTVFGSVTNYYVTIQSHSYPRFWQSKTLTDYWQVVGRDSALYWIDDNRLSVDLGKVYWVSSRLDKVGNIRVISPKDFRVVT